MLRYISIDPGKNTGYFIFDIDDQKNIIEREISSGSITQVIDIVKHQKALFNSNLYLLVEDARLCKWAGGHGKNTLQGVGSVKRDCSIWQDFCLENNIIVWLINPIKIKNKKLTKEQFNKLFDVTCLKNNSHSRDAVAIGMQFGLLANMLINSPNFKNQIINYI